MLGRPVASGPGRQGSELQQDSVGGGDPSRGMVPGSSHSGNDGSQGCGGGPGGRGREAGVKVHVH